MPTHQPTRLLAVIAVVMSALMMAPDVAYAVQTPEEENVLDAVSLPHPQLLPDVVDLGMPNSIVEALLPDVIDEWPTIAIGGCSLGLEGPALSPDGFRIQGAATLQCGEVQRATKLLVCIQRRVADRWENMKESCRIAISSGQTTTRKRTSAVCLPGTWKYRVFGAAVSLGSSPQAHAGPGVAVSIRCRAFGL